MIKIDTGTDELLCSIADRVALISLNKPHKKNALGDILTPALRQTLRLHELDKITVAALPGAAAGAGLSIALACDLRVASSNAFVTTAFKNIGLSGDYGASWFLPRLIGLSKAKELFYTADRVGAEEGLRLGLFNRVFPQETFREEAFAYARELANGPTGTLGRMKKNLNRGVDQGLRESLALEAEHLVDSAGSPEAREAITAFLEKRKPEFHGDK